MDAEHKSTHVGSIEHLLCIENYTRRVGWGQASQPTAQHASTCYLWTNGRK